MLHEVLLELFAEGMLFKLMVAVRWAALQAFSDRCNDLVRGKLVCLLNACWGMSDGTHADRVLARS